MINKNFKLVTDPQKVGQVANKISKAPSFSLDLETTGLNFMEDAIHGVALGTQDNEWYVCHNALPQILDHLPSLMEDKKIYMHNAPFDLKFLRRNLSLKKRYNVVDTMVAQAMLDENQKLGLKNLAKTQLGITEDLPDFGDLLNSVKRMLGYKKLSDINIYDLPLHKLANYAGRDARLTYDLGIKSDYLLEIEGYNKLFYETEMPFMWLLVNMEEAGFQMDELGIAKLASEYDEIFDFHWNKVIEIADGHIENPRSDKEVAHYLYNVLDYPVQSWTNDKKETPSVDQLALLKTKEYDKTGIIDHLLEMRKYGKLISTYINAFQTRTTNGRLYGSFNQTGTVTWRLSSDNPNLQNIPGRGETGAQIRNLFIAPDGKVVVVIDYSQLELRITAHYTKDDSLVQVFVEDGDPHQMTADLVGVERYIGKTLNFATLYGQGVYTFMNTMQKNGYERPTQDQAREWLAGFDRAYPRIPYWRELVYKHAKQLGCYVTTIGGHIRRLPDLDNYDGGLRARAERQAINSIIQGSAGDIIKKAMLDIDLYAHEFGAILLSQVHDELIWEVPAEAAQEFSIRASKSMTDVGKHFNLIVPLKADPGIGESWAKAK